MTELTLIYEKRGLDPSLARTVAVQLTAKNQLEAHVRDELGMSDATRGRPLQAALVSAASFGLLATLPIGALLLAPTAFRIPIIALAALFGLGLLGAAGGRLAGAPPTRGALRVLVGGAVAMAFSALIGRLLGVVGL